MFLFIIRAIFSIVNYIAIAFLLLSYVARHVSPESFWFIAFFGLAYPVFLIINILFVLFWAIQFKFRFIFSLLAIVLGLDHFNAFFRINIKNASVNNSTEKNEMIKVMSYNVRLFDLYNWSHNKQTRNKIFNLIQEEASGIVCLQEFFTDDSKEFNTLDTLLRIQKAKNYHVEYTITMRKIHHWGVATFSKYPIAGKGKIVFEEPSNNICIYTDLRINNDTVRVYNMHLQSIHFNPVDYKFLTDVVDIEKVKPSEEEIEEKSKGIIKRLKGAFVKRASQADIIAEHIKQCRYPVIVCGDFNDTPSSYAYATISKGLKDAFVESGNGMGRTYIGTFPSFRIDYIMHSPGFQSYEFHTISEELSDHYPVTCFLGYSNSKKE